MKKKSTLAWKGTTMKPKSPQFEILETQAFYAIWSESAVAILFTVRTWRESDTISVHW